jgi:ankyrin repeat protein
MYAIGHGNTRTAKMLLDRGANIEAEDKAISYIICY